MVSCVPLSSAEHLTEGRGLLASRTQCAEPGPGGVSGDDDDSGDLGGVCLVFCSALGSLD